jgi:hypothetical protein
MTSPPTTRRTPDGSIEIAFDVATGTAESVFRSGTIASVGLAGARYDLTFRSSRYLPMQERAAGYLLSLQRKDSRAAGVFTSDRRFGGFQENHKLGAP